MSITWNKKVTDAYRKEIILFHSSSLSFCFWKSFKQHILKHYLTCYITKRTTNECSSKRSTAEKNSSPTCFQRFLQPAQKILSRISNSCIQTVAHTRQKTNSYHSLHLPGTAGTIPHKPRIIHFLVCHLRFMAILVIEIMALLTLH